MDEKLLRDLQILTDLMEQDGWTSLRVTSADISVTLSDSDGERLVVPALAKRTAVTTASAVPTVPANTLPASAHVDIDPAWLVVKAPNLGTFYRSPKPGTPPFIEVGDQVQCGAELCLIEVMKLFTSVRAEVDGTIRHIAAADAELVEGGQPLMYIECK